jgi:hypothetical protein
MRDKLKENTLKDVNDGKKPHFVNKSEFLAFEFDAIQCANNSESFVYFFLKLK